MSSRPCACFADEKEAHPLFVYMARTSAKGIKKGVRVPSKWGVSSNPPKRVQELNAVEGFKAAGRAARKGAPYWILELVIGPFASGANRFKEECAKSRKISCRIQAGIQCACRVNALVRESHAPAELAKLAGCVPIGELVVWARDKQYLMNTLRDAKVKPRKKLKSALT